MSDDVTIRRFLDVSQSPKLGEGIDAIFFEASNTKTFESAEARASFRERWLGRYLSRSPEFAYLAVAASGAVAGYLVGSASDDFAGMGYAQNFRELAEKFPAHLHVNLAPAFRDRGIGGRLISAFLADVKRSGAGGAHVVTSADSRNVRFYNRNGFIEAGRSEGSNAIVFLARSL